MNKKTIIGFIRNQKTASKRGDKVFGNLYMLSSIYKIGAHGHVLKRKNAFWADENVARREELIQDIEAIENGFDLLDFGFLKILLRYERGDKYGIEKIGTVRIPEKLFELF